MQRALSFLLVLSLSVLTGCDPVFGVSRRGRIAFMPEPALVGTTIRNTPGIDAVQYRSRDGGNPVTWTGIKPADQVHTFSYRGGSNVHGSLQFIVDYRGRVEYSQTLMSMHRPPPQEWIDATRPIMVQIEAELEKSCYLTNLRASVVEKCIGVECK